jgi:predicted metal-binding membrane protein
MALLFVGGVMNVFSMTLIATLVLAEKMFRGHFLSRTVGAGLVVGGWLLMLPMSSLGHVQIFAAL